MWRSKLFRSFFVDPLDRGPETIYTVCEFIAQCSANLRILLQFLHGYISRGYKNDWFQLTYVLLCRCMWHAFRFDGNNIICEHTRHVVRLAGCNPVAFGLWGFDSLCSHQRKIKNETIQRTTQTYMAPSARWEARVARSTRFFIPKS